MNNLEFKAVETKTITVKLKKAYRPSYNCRDLDSTLAAAAQMSRAYKCDYQVIATAWGYNIISYTKTPTPGHAYYQTDGQTVTLYQRIGDSTP